MASRGRIFISYRRDDAPGDARSIRDRLGYKFGDASVFMDVDNLFAGQRFDQELDKALAQCEVLVVIIGRRWMDLLAENKRKGGRDYVRAEIAAALKRDIVVIPVLVGREGALPVLPRADELPGDIRDFVLFQKHAVAHESFGRDANELIAAVGAILRERSPPPWKGLPFGGLAGAVAGIVLLAALTGTALWVLSRPSAPGIAVTKKATDEIDAVTKKARDEQGQRPTAETTRSVIEEAARRRVELYQSQAAKGDASAMDRLGTFYEEGNGVPKDLQQAITWYQKAATRGNEDSKARLRRLKVTN